MYIQCIITYVCTSKIISLTMIFLIELVWMILQIAVQCVHRCNIRIISTSDTHNYYDSPCRQCLYVYTSQFPSCMESMAMDAHTHTHTHTHTVPRAVLHSPQPWAGREAGSRECRPAPWQPPTHWRAPQTPAPSSCQTASHARQTYTHTHTHTHTHQQTPYVIRSSDTGSVSGLHVLFFVYFPVDVSAKYVA